MNKKIKTQITINLIVLYLFIFIPKVFASGKISGSSAKIISQLDPKNINKSSDYLFTEMDHFIYIKKQVIKKILEKYQSPLASVSDVFIKACIKYDLDCYLLPAIAGVESTFGRYAPYQSFNPFGWGNALIKFENWEDAIQTVARGLKEGYINRGLSDLETIGRVYAPASLTWSKKVDFFMKEFYNEEFKINKLNLYFYD